MSDLFRFLVQYEVLVYVILTGTAIIAARSLWKAWFEWHSAVYALEKELSFQKVRVFGAFFILLMMIGLSLFCLVSFIVPYLPSITFQPTATADLLQTPSGTAIAANLTPGTTQIATPSGSTGCIPGQIMLSTPQSGTDVQGKIILKGTVNVSNFGFYKYEYVSKGNDTWATIAAGDKVKNEEDLGAWDTSQLLPGDYQLRLIVTDNLGNLLTPCIINIRVITP